MFSRRDHANVHQLIADHGVREQPHHQHKKDRAVRLQIVDLERGQDDIGHRTDENTREDAQEHVMNLPLLDARGVAKFAEQIQVHHHKHDQAGDEIDQKYRAVADKGDAVDETDLANVPTRERQAHEQRRQDVVKCEVTPATREHSTRKQTDKLIERDRKETRDDEGGSQPYANHVLAVRGLAGVVAVDDREDAERP